MQTYKITLMPPRFSRGAELGWRLSLDSISLLSVAGEKRPGWNCPLPIYGCDFNSLGLRAIAGIRLLRLSIGNQNVTETEKGLGRWKKGRDTATIPRQFLLRAIQPMPVVLSCLFPCTCFWSSGNYLNQGNICKLSEEVESLRQLERETLLFLRLFIEGYPHCHLCFREVLPLITDSVYFSHVWCSRLGAALWATVLLSQSFLWTLQPYAINLSVVLGWPTQRARYFLEAVFHFPMASYCENAMIGSLYQHCFSLSSSLHPACPLEAD